ncbi:MAG: replication factor C large subunit [Halobacteriales archaeon]|jgi:replication factor C large subunit
MDWTEKYRPSTLAEVRGNDTARDSLREWAETWDDHREAAILHGAPGVGKTSAAHALASDLGWPTIELNASDQRTADVIERVAGEAAKSGTLTAGESGRRLIILDEADNVHGTHDRGGTRAITGLVKEASQPMVLIANDYYDMSKGLRNACREIEFRDVSARSIVPVLRDVCRKEGVEFESAALEAIAERTDGDLRSAINDLQAAAEGRDRITEDDVVTGERDRTEGIFDFLDIVIKEADAEEALTASYDVDETPDDLINWIEDNVPKDYHGPELADAFDSLSRADRWLGRVRATQDYSYWRYAADNMTAGVAAARRGDKGGWTRYGPPSYWSKLGRTRGTRETRDEIARKIAERAGTNLATARRDVLPYLSAMTHHCRDRELTVRMAAAYDLDTEEVSFVTGSGESTNKVQSIVEEARDRRDAAIESHAGSAFEGARNLDAANKDDDGPTNEEAKDGDDAQLTLADSDDDGSSDESVAGDGDDGATREGDSDDRTEKAANDDAQSGLGDFT